MESLDDYRALWQRLKLLPIEEAHEAMRELGRRDLFFLLVFLCGRQDMWVQWVLDRCKEVQAEPDGMLDLWSRGYWKSSIITFGLTLKDILASHGDNPLPEWEGKEPTFGIFACTRGIAKAFLGQLKTEFENNKVLRMLYPDIIWENPKYDSPSWSEEGGIILKRKANPKESTVEAWGVVDNQPTSKHFDVQVYDDLITREYVSSVEMIDKVTSAWELSLNLGSQKPKRRYIGTRYHFWDTYRVMMDRCAVKPRIYAATDDGTFDGEPLVGTKEDFLKKVAEMGTYTAAAQLLQNPLADSSQGFKNEWLRYYDGELARTGLNIYMLVDPANAKKANSDFTAIFIIGLGADKNYYVLDVLRDKLNLTERANAVMEMHRRWRPRVVGYEKYGKDSDIQHIEFRMQQDNYRFEIMELGGRMSKTDRIRRLIPLFEQKRVFLPRTLHKTNYEGKIINLTQSFVQEEYLAFPISLHDDMLDCMARICDNDIQALFPDEGEAVVLDKYARAKNRGKRRQESVWAV